MTGCSAAASDDAVAASEQATVTCNPSALPFGGGDGTPASPYLLCAADQLVHLGDSPSQASYRLTKNIDLTSTPVRSITRFVGVLDGANNSIIGLVADGTNTQGAWIGEQRGYIKNLRMSGARIQGTALLAERNFGVIESSDFDGEVTTGSTSGAGGVVAQNQGLISNVHVTGTIAGASMVGGIVGDNTVLGRVRHSFFDGKVLGGSLFIGGIAGSNDGLLFDVHAKGSVLMGGGVGRGAGGIAGWLGGVIDLASADVTTYSENSAGGLVGRSRGGTLSRAFATGKVRANENAGGIIGLVEFGAAFTDAYAIADVVVDHSGAQAFGGDCARCFFKGTVAGVPTSVVSLPSGQQDPASANLGSASTFAAYGAAWDLGGIAAAGRPRLAWEASPPSAPPVDVVPVQVGVFQPSTGAAKTLVFRENTTHAEIHGAFGGLAGSQWISAVVYVPAGEYTFAASKADDGFWSGSWCSMTTSPSQPWTATTSRTMTVATTPINEQSLWISCPSDGNPDFPVHPGPGEFLSGLPQGTPLLQDDAEGTTVPWELIGLWHRATSTPCVTPSAAAGVGAFWYGDPNGCNYDHRPTSGNGGSIGIGWMTSPPIAGLQQGSKIEFDSYRDIGGRDETNVIIFPHGQGSRVHDDLFQTKVWARSGPMASDRGWEHVTITLPWAWYYGQTVQVRFATETYEAFDHRDQKGWLVDNVKISR